MTFIKLKINQEKLKNIIGLASSKIRVVLLGIVVIITIFILIFLYHNFYLTITSAKKIDGLQNELSANIVNEKLLKEIEDNLEKKISQPDKKWKNFSELLQKNNSTAQSINTDNFKPQTKF